MSTSARTVEYITEQISTAGDVRYRKMFGEYALYCDDKVVALVCDDQLYLKPTAPGRTYLQEVDAAPPYPGAKIYYRISEDRWDDREWMTTVVKLTAAALPLPATKKTRRPSPPNTA